MHSTLVALIFEKEYFIHSVKAFSNNNWIIFVLTFVNFFLSVNKISDISNISNILYYLSL